MELRNIGIKGFRYLGILDFIFSVLDLGLSDVGFWDLVLRNLVYGIHGFRDSGISDLEFGNWYLVFGI